MSINWQKWELTCFDPPGLDCPLYLSSAELPQPSNKPSVQLEHEKILEQFRIGNILNMSIDSLALKYNRDWYEECEIKLYEKPIQDVGGIHVKDSLLNEIVDIYRNRQKIREMDLNEPDELAKSPLSMLVHCSLGINRSALACGAILWAETHPAYSGQDSRPWDSPQLMIEWMRNCQRKSRKLVLLSNGWMEMSLINWCLKYDQNI